MAVPGLKNFSVGNRDVVSTHVRQGQLLVKGRQVGFSDLVVWDKGGRRSLNVYVLSKTSFLKTIQLTEALKDLNLRLDLKGPLMVVSGEVSRAEDWRYLQHLRRLHQERVVFHAQAAAELRRAMAADVYRDLFAAGLRRVACHMRFLDMECHWEGEAERAAELLASLRERWGVKFVKRASRWSQGNFRLSLKLIQVERLDGQEISFGLSGLRASVGDLFKHGLRKLVEENAVALGESHVRLSTLAEPEALVRVGAPHLVEVGAQIPFQNLRQGEGVVLAPIDWRFAGLKLTTKLEERDGGLALNYETEFTRPVDNGISGSREKSSLVVRPGEAYALFKIGYKSDGEERKHWPGLENVPLLRTLFGSRGRHAVYKRIEGYLVLEEVP